MKSKDDLLCDRILALSDRLDKLRKAQEDGRLGPRVVRARLHIISKERLGLVKEARVLGYDVD